MDTVHHEIRHFYVGRSLKTINVRSNQYILLPSISKIAKIMSDGGQNMSRLLQCMSREPIPQTLESGFFLWLHLSYRFSWDLQELPVILAEFS